MCRFLFSRSGILLIAVVAFLLYHVKHTFPEDFEDSSTLQAHAIFSKLLNTITHWLWKAGAGDPFIAHRVIFAALQKLGGESEDAPGVEVVNATMNGVSVLVFVPKTRQDNGPGVIYLHGGGYILGSTSMYRAFTSYLAQQLNCVLVAVAYRIGPQHVYPDALSDAVEVTRHFIAEGHQQYSVDPKRVAVAGDSSGGHLAATAALKMLMEPQLNKTPLKAVGLIAPLLQYFTFNTPSYLEHLQDPFLPRSMGPLSMFALSRVPERGKYYDMLLTNGHVDFETRESFARRFGLLQLNHRGPTHLESGGIPEAMETFKHFYEDPLLSPLFGNFSQFPPTVILSAKFDVLRDDSVMMIQRLRAANRTVEHVGIRSCHSCFVFYKSYAPAKRALERWTSHLRYYL